MIEQEKERNLYDVIVDCIKDAVRESFLEIDESLKDDWSIYVPQREREKAPYRDVYKGFRSIRNDFEHECYGENNDHAHTLDYRKALAMLCVALIRNKVFRFSEQRAIEWYDKECQIINDINDDAEQKKERKKFNLKLANNIFINYKVAYLAALHFLFYFLLYETSQKGIEDEVWKDVFGKLSTKKHLVQYASTQDEDSFDVNMILGLAKSDMQGKELNLYFLSLQFYQIEMFTRCALGDTKSYNA